MRRLLWLLFTLLFIGCAIGAEPLPVDAVFKPTVQVQNPHSLQVTWQISPGTYIYRDRIHFSARPANLIRLAHPQFPPTQMEKAGPQGESLGVYSQQLTVTIPLLGLETDQFVLQASYQGCAEAGFCYPPTTKAFSINLSPPFNKTIYPSKIDLPPTQHIPTTTTPKKKWAGFTIGGFFLLGLLMAFTPCVLPMVPIVAGIVVGNHRKRSIHGILLALAYVIGMAITYAIVGIVLAALGANLQSSWQSPWVISILAILFIVMALALFDVFSLELPSSWQVKLQSVSNHQKHGKMLGAFIMGILATLILSPCVTPALVGALAYITQTGNWITGGVSLFAMGIGMGVPLLLVGWLGHRLVSASGPWLSAIKYAIGVLMIAVALVLLSRVWSHWISQLAWGGFFVGLALAVRVFNARTKTTRDWIKKIFGVICLLYGLALWFQLAFAPQPGALPVININHQTTAPIKFKPISTPTELQTALTNAGDNTVLLDFSAKWCISCQIMEQQVFTKPQIKNALKNFVLLQVDITNPSAGEQQIQQQWSVIAPPTLLFIQNSKEIHGSRIIGEITANTLLKHIESLK